METRRFFSPSHHSSSLISIVSRAFNLAFLFLDLRNRAVNLSYFFFQLFNSHARTACFFFYTLSCFSVFWCRCLSVLRRRFSAASCVLTSQVSVSSLFSLDRRASTSCLMILLFAGESAIKFGFIVEDLLLYLISRKSNASTSAELTVRRGR